jgi:hypothetical protein
VFSEPVTTASAQNTANYSITPSQSVTSAVLSASMDSVTLTVSPGFVNGQLYNVTIINVTDTSANANVMDPFNAMFYFNSYNGTDLKITEIMHSQATGSVGQIDYFEMHNTGTSSIALEGMEFTSGIQMNILTPLSIPAGGYLVFTQNIDSFNLAFPSVTNVIQWEGGSLSGGGETITMSNTLRDDVVSVSFMTSAPWPAYSNMEAIELCDVNTDYTNPSNWYYSANVSTTVGTTLYGTPGAASSCATPPFIPTYDIATVTSVDVDGVPDSLGVYCKVEGIVYGVDLDGNNGISFTLIDETGGINIFNFNDVDNYVVNQGDEIRAVGEIDFFNGLLELFPDSITVLSTGNCIPFPTVVSTLGEETESQYIELKNAKLANPSSWPSPGSNANLDVITANGDTVVMRIDRDTQIPDSLLAGPSGTFNLIGIGGQFDNSSPYLEGYQIFPMFVSDFDSTKYDAPAGLQMNEIAVVNSSTYADMDGDYSQWVEMFNNSGSTIDLTGYFLSTDSQNVFMERIERCFQNSPAQATIDAGEYGVGFTNSTKPGPQYFELEMTTANPFIGFYTPNGTLVDSYEFPTTVAVEGYTYGAKNDDHAQGDVIFEIGTPEATNAAGQILSVFSPSKINALVAYPNPVENGLVQFNKVVSVKVYSITGQILVVRENVKSLDVSTLNAGVYLLETEEGEVVRLLVK